ncbi:TRAP transporter small permease [Parasulfitobacter algicola]|uniref:TRAP transporter small permease protein n=1 Tax=Parasulfitobacter algicola TaxID=2614809 RepID=A0ABX2IZL4_9RHOB|nr:TRAP transporter small permease [Sulfitobacter algicola]NSX56860.1 TRAP transporter small permease [Sulfitobacter algicola]
MIRFLNMLYKIAGGLAGLLILAICLLISAQVMLNAAGRISPGLLPPTIPSYRDFSGFMLAGATFLAMAHTLRAGGHIRVNLVTQRFADPVQAILEGIVLTLTIALTAFATWYMGALVEESWRYNDLSNGIIPIPLWAPQSVTCFGMALLTLALVHTLVDLIRARKPVLTNPDEV